MGIPFFVDNNGVPMERNKLHTVAVSEVGTTETTPIDELIKAAAHEAQKVSTKKS